MAGELSVELRDKRRSAVERKAADKPGKNRKKKAAALLFGILLLAFWEGLSLLIDSKIVLPGPWDVAESLWEKRVEIFTIHLPATMYVVLVGGVSSILFGALMAILMDASDLIRRAVYPILTVTQVIPTMCVAPVLVLWLGYSVEMRIVVVILVNFFPVTIDLFDGLRAVNREQAELMDTFGAGVLYKFIHLKMPSALPYFFSSLHVVVPWAVIGATIAEWLGAPAGLGICSKNGMAELDAAALLAPLVVLTVVALLLNRLVGLIERPVLRHRD